MRQNPAVELVIRPERDDDHAAIRTIVGAAFESDAEADLVERIRASDGYVADLALVATLDDSVVGHVMISVATMRTDAGERPIVMLSPLAVAPSMHRRGIGGELVRAVTAAAAAAGHPFVVLEGDPRYYERFGFEPAARYGVSLPLPDWAPEAAAQLLPLDRFEPSDLRGGGQVVYPPAFDGVE